MMCVVGGGTPVMVGVGGGGLGVGPLGRPDALTLALSHRGCCAQPPSFRRKPESRGAGQGEGARDLTVNPSYVRLCTAPGAGEGIVVVGDGGSAIAVLLDV